MTQTCSVLLMASGPLPAPLADLCTHLRESFPDCPWQQVESESAFQDALLPLPPRLVLVAGAQAWALSAIARQPLPMPVIQLSPGEDFALARHAFGAGCKDVILPGEGERLAGWMRRASIPDLVRGESWQEREQRLRLLLDTMPEFVCYKDGAGRWLETNAFGLELFRLAPGAYRGLTDLELARRDPELAPTYAACRASDERAWQAGQAVRGTECVPNPAGGEGRFDVVKVPLFQPDGQRQGLLIIGRDVSEQYRAEQALQHSEEDLRRFAGALAGLGGDFRLNIQALTDLAGELLCAHRARCVLDRTDRAPVVCRWSRQPEAADTDGDLAGACDRLLAGPGEHDGQEQNLETVRDRVFLGQVIHNGAGNRAGSLCLEFVGPQPHRPAQSSLLALLARAIESEVKRHDVERALRDSEAHYREFFEHDLTADYISTPEGRLLDCNPAFVKLFGFESREEALGCNTRELFPDPEARERFLAQLRGQGKVEYQETELRRRDGQVVYTILNTLGGFDSQGNLVRLLGFLFDITRHKQLQQQFHQAQKMESIGRLAGGVAHDFNNLLTVINGHAELLLSLFSEHDPVRDSLNQIGRAGERAARLTRQLLAFSRRQVLQLEPLDLDQVVGEMHSMLERLIGTDIHLEARLSGGLPAVMADAGQLELVLVNLVVNARDAMPGGGRLRITTDLAHVDAAFCREHPPMRPGLYCLLEVEDEGSGMDPDTLSRVFEPFFTTKAKGKGTGLGLATVYGIIKQVGGFIWLESRPGQGTRVSIFLKPETGMHAAVTHEAGGPSGDAAASPAAVGSRPVPGALPGSGTVLIVEDEEMVRQLAASLLRGQGYRVLEAGDGRQALDLIHRGEEVNLVLSDLVMPRMGGRELGRELYRLCPGLPVLYMSGHAEGEEQPGEGLPGGRGAQALLAKPFERRELLRRVGELLGRSR
jgi:two-component system cell cycle sensor histidine kinase/response regulator CckA